jgi:hypothetical protein
MTPNKTNLVLFLMQIICIYESAFGFTLPPLVPTLFFCPQLRNVKIPPL